MVLFLELPTELRQQIISETLPSEYCPTVPCPAHIISLLLACRQLHLDTLRMVEAWSPKVIIRDPEALDKLSRLYTQRRKFKLRTLTLQIFAMANIDDLKRWVGTYRCHALLESWSKCVGHLPGRGGVSEVIIDLTLVPQWVLQKRTDWVYPLIADRRVAVLFLAEHRPDVETLLRRLDTRYNNDRGHVEQHDLPLVAISMGGWLGWRSKPSIKTIVANAQQNTAMRWKPQFVGIYIHESDVPTAYSLLKISQDWGVKLAHARPTMAFSLAGTVRPEVDFSDLNPVKWSTQSKTEFYQSTIEDAPGTLADLKRLLAFALENQREPSGRDLDFESGASDRRRLIHLLCVDLRLHSMSADDDVGRYVRVFGTLNRTRAVIFGR